jgi:hypothetical protein
MVVVCSNWMCGSVIPESGNVLEGDEDERFFVCPRCRALSRIASVFHLGNDKGAEAAPSIPTSLLHS